FEDQGLHVSGRSRLYAQAQSGDDMPFQVRSSITDNGPGRFQIWQRDFSRICKQLERHLWGAPSLPPISTSSRQLRDCTDSKVVSIAHELKRKISVGGNQDRSFIQFPFECLKGFNTLFGDNEWGIFLEKTGHRPGYL
nr:hypothetical protein [Tanacetum cinerariifolium]